MGRGSHNLLDLWCFQSCFPSLFSEEVLKRREKKRVEAVERMWWNGGGRGKIKICREEKMVSAITLSEHIRSRSPCFHEVMLLIILMRVQCMRTVIKWQDAVL